MLWLSLTESNGKVAEYELCLRRKTYFLIIFGT